MWLCVAVLLMLTVLPARAEIILANSIGSPHQVGAVFDDQETIRAVGVGIPAGTDYLFEKFLVVLRLDEGAPEATGRIYHHDGTGIPGAELRTLDTQPVDTLFNNSYEFTSPAPFTLEAGQRYWFGISDGPALGRFDWRRRNPAEEPAGTADFLGYTVTGNSGASWAMDTIPGGYNSFQLHATPVPEAHSALLIATALLVLGLAARARALPR